MARLWRAESSSIYIYISRLWIKVVSFLLSGVWSSLIHTFRSSVIYFRTTQFNSINSIQFDNSVQFEDSIQWTASPRFAARQRNESWRTTGELLFKYEKRCSGYLPTNPEVYPLRYMSNRPTRVIYINIKIQKIPKLQNVQKQINKYKI